MDTIRHELTSYFAAEKAESVLFILAGLGAIGLSVWLWRTGAPLRGMGFPLVLFGLIQLGVGGGVFLRTDRQVAALEAQLSAAPADFQAAERARMATVQRNFELYKWVELGLLATGIVLSFVARRRDLWYGVAIGLVLQSSVMLVLDLVAEHRGARYLEQIRRAGSESP